MLVHSMNRFFFNKNSVAIIISDVHLGDIYSKVVEFELFLVNLLKEIEYENLPYLKTLIVLGDFFDVMRTSFLNLCVNQNYIRIYELLEIIKNYGIFIVFALGNHEIPTTGFYNQFFKLRKIVYICI